MQFNLVIGGIRLEADDIESLRAGAFTVMQMTAPKMKTSEDASEKPKAKAKVQREKKTTKSRAIPKRNCTVCQKEYQPNGNRQFFCSNSCRRNKLTAYVTSKEHTQSELGLQQVASGT
jgi:endogenous inhibitor of DNA gyrase (YacG/DUF329 family)